MFFAPLFAIDLSKVQITIIYPAGCQPNGFGFMRHIFHLTQKLQMHIELTLTLWQGYLAGLKGFASNLQKDWEQALNNKRHIGGAFMELTLISLFGVHQITHFRWQVFIGSAHYLSNPWQIGIPKLRGGQFRWF